MGPHGLPTHFWYKPQHSFDKVPFFHCLKQNFASICSTPLLCPSHFQITLSLSLSHSHTPSPQTYQQWRVERNWSPVATNTSGATRRGATTAPSCNQFQRMVNSSQEASSSSSFPPKANVKLRRAGRGSITPFWAHSQRSTDMPRWTSYRMHGPNKHHGKQEGIPTMAS